MYKGFKQLMSDGRLVPTNAEWREIQIATATDVGDQEHNRVGVHQKIVDGRLVHEVRVLRSDLFPGYTADLKR